MLTVLFLLGALAGEPSLKGGRLLDDGAPALSVKTQKIPGGTVVTTITSLEGAPVVVFSVARYAPGQAMLQADFQGLGVSFGAQVGDLTPDAQILEWWGAGVLSAAGADRAALQTWAQAHTVALVDTAAQQQKLEAYAATHPGPSFSPPASASASSASSSAPPASASGASAPSTVSVELHIACKERVRVFLGASANSGGTYGWESPNSVRSVTVKPGSVICIANAQDKVQTCWTAGSERARLDVDCGGFRAR